METERDVGQGLEASRDVGGQDGDDAPSESSSDADIFDPRWVGMSAQDCGLGKKRSIDSLCMHRRVRGVFNPAHEIEDRGRPR